MKLLFLAAFFFFLIALMIGFFVLLLHRKVSNKGNKLVEEVNHLLPQTQCGQCGHPGCLPYAEAVVLHHEALDKCTPGGIETAKKIAYLLDKKIDMEQTNLSCKEQPSLVAYIDEEKCIGCARCIQACPVDSIVGATSFLHTVVADLCTGCELCIAVCPVDCITMEAYTNNKTLLIQDKHVQAIDLITTDMQAVIQ